MDARQGFEEDPSLPTLSLLARELRDNGKMDEMRELLLGFYEKFSLNEQMWLDWVEAEHAAISNQGADIYMHLLGLALDDFPLSTALHRFRIDHAQSETDRLAAVQVAVNSIGPFDNAIWDEYRKLCPAESDAIYRKQLALPVPDYDRILGEYRLEVLVSGGCGDDFQPSEETMAAVTLLALRKNDFRDPASALAMCGRMPIWCMFERALSYHPALPAIWSAYLTRFPTEKLAARAVRFCPKSGLLWAARARITGEIDMTGFDFIGDVFEAQILLGQLTALDESRAIETISMAVDKPIFSASDNWVWPTILLESHMKRVPAMKGERVKLIEDAVARNNQSMELWMRLVEAKNDACGEDAAREVFRRASCEMKLNVHELMQRWIAFESCSVDKKFDAVVERLNELAVKDTSKRPTEEAPADHEKRTVFIANLDGMTTEDDVQKLFAQSGEVESVRLKKRHGNASYGFVQFRHSQDAHNAVMMLNGAVFRDKKIDVKPHETRPVLTLFIRYASDASPSEIIQFLREAAGTTSFDVRFANETRENAEEKGHRTKGWGFVDLKSESDAMKFMALNGRIFKTQALKIEVAHQNRKERFADKKTHPRYEPRRAPATQEKGMDDDQMKAFFNLT